MFASDDKLIYVRLSQLSKHPIVFFVCENSRLKILIHGCTLCRTKCSLTGGNLWRSREGGLRWEYGGRLVVRGKYGGGGGGSHQMSTSPPQMVNA